MAYWHGYIGIENIALSNGQRQTLIQALRALGPSDHPSPACLLHWRPRLDSQAAIFEALFDEDHLTIQTFKNRLAAIFGVNPNTIDSHIAYPFLGGVTPVVTFSRLGTDYLRFALFSGQGASWEQSGNECRAYLRANASEWEG